LALQPNLPLIDKCVDSASSLRHTPAVSPNDEHTSASAASHLQFEDLLLDLLLLGDKSVYWRVRIALRGTNVRLLPLVDSFLNIKSAIDQRRRWPKHMDGLDTAPLRSRGFLAANFAAADPFFFDVAHRHISLAPMPFYRPVAPRNNHMRLNSFGLNVLFTTARAPLGLEASFFIRSPC